MTGYYAVYRGNKELYSVTKDKKYDVLRFMRGGHLFTVTSNHGNELICIPKACAHLQGGNWHIGKYPEDKS